MLYYALIKALTALCIFSRINRRIIMKRIISLLLILLTAVFVLSLTGCGNDDKSGDPAQSKTSVTSSVSIPDDLTPYGTNADGNPTGYFKNEYDSSKRLTRNYTYDSLGRLQGSTGYEYDENGNEKRNIMYDANGEVLSQELFERTADGTITKDTKIDKSGTVVSVIEYTYTSFGRPLTIARYDGSGKYTGGQEYKYDENENLSQFTQYKGENLVEFTVTYVTNDDGSVTEYKYDGDGNLINN